MSASASYLTESTNKFHAVATVQVLSPAQQLENLVITLLYQIKTILLSGADLGKQCYDTEKRW